MKTLLRTAIAAALLPSLCGAQLLPAPAARRNPSDQPIPSSLHAAWRLRELPLEELRTSVGRDFVSIDDARRIHVEIVGPRGSLAVSDAFVQSFGGVVDTRWRHRVDTWVPLDFLMDLTRALPTGHRLVRPSAGVPEDVTGEGPTVVGTDEWREGGADGAGQVIAVIDSSWAGLSAAVANGDAPGSYTAVNFTPSAFQAGTNVHGTGCLEQVFDHAPGATYRLYKTDSATDLHDVVKNCQTNGVDIISRSLGSFNEAWSDGESELCDPIQAAGDSGILFVNSAGNYAQRHWEGTMNGGAGSPDWHDWVGGDELLAIQVPDGKTLNLFLLWDDGPSGSEDYDLYLYDSALNEIASSTSPFEFHEDLSWTNSSGATVTVHAAVWRFSGAATSLELFGDEGTWEYAMAAGSVPPGLSCAHPNLVVVGAVDQADYAAASGATGIIEPYSSQGPTNGGSAIIDVVAPAQTTAFVYPGGFGGTSCAAPNVAGTLACLWSSVPNYETDPIRWLLQRHGSVFKDWGATGYDHVYGYGGANLIDFAPDTRWLTKEYSNSTGMTAFPVNTLDRAMTLVPSGGRIVAFPGGDFPELANPSGPLVLTKPVTIVSRGATAEFAD